MVLSLLMTQLYYFVNQLNLNYNQRLRRSTPLPAVMRQKLIAFLIAYPIATGAVDQIDLSTATVENWAELCRKTLIMGATDYIAGKKRYLYDIRRQLNIGKHRQGHLPYLDACYSAGAYHAESLEH